MSGYSGEEVAEGLEAWLRARREEYLPGKERDAIDYLLDEARDCAAEGWTPWERMGEMPDDAT